MAEPADINVDELRRRARRRLVGAVVLALAVAVIVPMLLESQPKPLGDDVSVKIPPVDNGKFVNQLSGSTADATTASGAIRNPASGGEDAKAAATDAAGARTAPAPAASTASTAPAASAPAAAPAPAPAAAPADTGKPRKYDTRIPEGSGGKPAAVAAEKAPASAGEPAATAAAKAHEKPSRVASAEPSTSTAKHATTAAPAAHAAAAVEAEKPAHGAGSVHEGYAVQLAAFSDDKGANALAHRLKAAGFSAYTEPLKTSKGTLWRVRVGPYPSREAAIVARDRLKQEGHSGIVAPAG
jgi:DedD protein